MPSVAEEITGLSSNHSLARSSERWLPLLLAAAAVFLLFYRLGSAPLFEPDEGRNAEKAREILVLNDWVTPHENFHPVLDKPIFFYWLIALCYKVFSVSEWSARLPSTLAALACVLLVYRFARVRWGPKEALWSALILCTNIEFFILGRLAIFDMTLTFFHTLALWAFFEAEQTEKTSRRRNLYALMYLALGAGTLAKGLIGVVIPGIIVFFYVTILRRWQILRKMYLLPGALIFLAVTLPWYLLSEAHNPGYLSYYIWSEHFGRYATEEFERWEPWYYFIAIGTLGFFPWTLALPWVAKENWQRKVDDKTLFLILWVVVPFLFFSASKSKLPHYILPIFPPLSILTGVTLVQLYRKSESKTRLVLALGWLIQSLNALYFAVGSLYPTILPHQVRHAIVGMDHLLWAYAPATVALLGYMSWPRRKNDDWRASRPLFLVQGLGMAFFLIFLAEIMIEIAPARSAETIVAAALPQKSTDAQVVLYDTYLAGAAFYLRVDRPIWLVTYSRKKRTFLGNYYAIGKGQDPITPWGQAILDFGEFRTRWQTTKQRLLVILKEKNLARLVEEVGEAPKKIATDGEYVLVANR